MMVPENDESADAAGNAAALAGPMQPTAAGEGLFTLAVDGRMRSRDEVVRAAQDYFCSLVPPDRVLSEELIADRRQEFLKEEAEFGASPLGTRE